MPLRHAILFASLLLALPAAAKDTVRIAFIGPLTGGVSANGIGGRNSADLAVRVRNADSATKYEYELVVPFVANKNLGPRKVYFEVAWLYRFDNSYKIQIDPHQFLLIKPL